MQSGWWSLAPRRRRIARPLRIGWPGAPCHVMDRGDRRERASRRTADGALLPDGLGSVSHPDEPNRHMSAPGRACSILPVGDQGPLVRRQAGGSGWRMPSCHAT